MTKHRSFYMNVDGEPIHTLANPNMSPETQHALEELVRAARKMAADMPVYQCAACGAMRTSVAGGICTQCKIDQLWRW